MPNVAMWGKALSGMPRIGKSDWDELEEVVEEIYAGRRAARDRSVPEIA